MRILIAPDKFKGSLTAAQAAGAIRRGIESALPGTRCRELPIADGGEGTVEILCTALGGKWVSVHAQDPLGRPVAAGYALLPGGVAAVAMSAASGLWRVAPGERDLLRASTYGTGELMLDAIRHGARRILVCLGGSATNDAGIGVAAALGWRFLDRDGQSIDPILGRMPELATVCPPSVTLPEVIGLCDVSNPLLGHAGATWTYGPQKGGNERTLPVIEATLTHLANVISKDLGIDFRDTPGSGAAGGLGFGLQSFCGARLRSGFEAVADVMDLRGAMASSDLVVTGEGRMDAQTLSGKGPAGVATMARQLGKPVIAFAGSVLEPAALAEFFDGVFAIKDEKDETLSLETAIREAASLLERKAASVAADLTCLVAAR